MRRSASDSTLLELHIKSNTYDLSLGLFSELATVSQDKFLEIFMLVAHIQTPILLSIHLGSC